MPQFDFTKFIPQIFWFSICFIALYTFTAAIILPRIREILKGRKTIISADLSEAAFLEEKINQARTVTEKLRNQAGTQYQSAIDLASKNVAKYREESLEEMKVKLDEMVQKSNHEIKNFVAESQRKNSVAIESLTKQLQEKILN